MLAVTLRAPGCQPFGAELEPSATVAELKIAATAGCDIDPEAMRVILNGKVLEDGDTLQGWGVLSGATVHIARGKAAAAGAVPPAAAAAAPLVPLVAGALCITVRGPAGDVRLEALSPGTCVAELRRLAARQLGLGDPEQVHLLRKAKVLHDADTLASSGVADEDILRVAKRATPQAAEAAAACPVAAVTAPRGPQGAAMPSAWGGSAQGQLALAPEGFGDLHPDELQEVMRALAAAQARREGPGLEATGAELRQRLGREAQDIERQVQQIATERFRALGLDAEEGDLSELLGRIAHDVAAARARGAPTPNPRRYVDQAVERARQRVAFRERLRRESEGLDPDVEDALAAVEDAAAARERLARGIGGRRLGGGAPPP